MRTLRGRLTTGLVLLLAVACLAVGVATSLLLQRFLIGRLDQQIIATGGRFPASLGHRVQDRDADDRYPDTRGQAPGTFGARILGSQVVQQGLVRNGPDSDDTAVRLSAVDRRSLLAVPVDGEGHQIELSTLDDYRVVAVRGEGGEVLVTGLPVHPVEETVERLVLVEAVVFVIVLLISGMAGAGLIRLSLRPLRRVATTAVKVTELPLSSGAVDLSQRVPDVDRRTEVGQVGTALNRMLEHVEEALEHRHASEERLRRFAADASHELRTPVAAVRGHAELALRSREPLPEDVRHALTRIEAESVRMGDLVDELLLLARLDAGRPLLEEEVDLTRVVLDGTSDARATGPDHRWVLELPERPVLIVGDGRRLHQVLMNLLTNASSHTPAGTTVTVRITRHGTWVRLEVEDDGPGIPKPMSDEVFERFARADKSRTRASGGSGLGLAIVKAVVQAHGGHVALESTPGHTLFRVDLPGDRKGSHLPGDPT
ncbi:sensor histidine kinase [Herbidospora mongoliensis]|uniref:sensor histidine kinase n=1 Tax=Herbidospora mongoliensis TaxID=688067 RepID=UPI0008345FFE|nr:HAMP domain-containing sensor histidine kinase [Herbidospora mongoliensis]